MDQEPSTATAQQLAEECEQIIREKTIITPYVGVLSKAKMATSSAIESKKEEEKKPQEVVVEDDDDYEDLGDNICYKCREEILPTKKDRQIFSENKKFTWHEHCFRCEDCRRALAWTGYFKLEKEVYCAQCMDDNHSEICQSCDLRIRVYVAEEKQVSSKDGQKHWHEACFHCLRCGEPLLGHGYFTAGNAGGMYCASCYDEQEADRCNKCHLKIFRCSQNERQVTSKDRKKHWHAKCYLCTRCNKSMVGVKHYRYEEDDQLYCGECYDQLASKICFKCKDRIFRCSRGEQQISSKEHPIYWHDRCYTCEGCSKSLVGVGHFWHDDCHKYCAGCYDEVSGNRCDWCNKLIQRYSKQEKQIVSKDHAKFWHDSCYVCWNCHKHLAGQKVFQLPNKRNMYCCDCYDEAVAYTCCVCKTLILRHSKGEKLISFNDGKPGAKYWHDYCYQCNKCKRSLMFRGHFPHKDGMTYCDRCFDDLTAATCVRCMQLIYKHSKSEKQLVSKDKEKHWHEKCFTCSRCRKSLIGEVCFSKAESVFCAGCAKSSGYTQTGPPKRDKTPSRALPPEEAIAEEAAEP